MKYPTPFTAAIIEGNNVSYRGHKIVIKESDGSNPTKVYSVDCSLVAENGISTETFGEAVLEAVLMVDQLIDLEKEIRFGR